MTALMIAVLALAGSGGMFAVGLAAGLGAGIGSGTASGRKSMSQQVRDTVTRRGLQVVDASGHPVPVDALFGEGWLAAGTGGGRTARIAIIAGVALLVLGVLLALFLTR